MRPRLQHTHDEHDSAAPSPDTEALLSQSAYPYGAPSASSCHWLIFGKPLISPRSTHICYPRRRRPHKSLDGAGRCAGHGRPSSSDADLRLTPRGKGTDPRLLGHSLEGHHRHPTRMKSHEQCHVCSGSPATQGRGGRRRRRRRIVPSSMCSSATPSSSRLACNTTGEYSRSR